MATLQLYFLGPLELRHDASLPGPPTVKSQSLLAYLAFYRQRPHPRKRLAGLFWSERPERKARRSLSTALWHIRCCLPGDCLLSDTHTVQFHPQCELWIDVEAFEARATSTNMDDLQVAVTLYRGDLLDGFDDEWITGERYRLETLFHQALSCLMTAYEAEGAHQLALTIALRLLGRDPLREEAHRLAMRSYCCLGQRNAALAQYGLCQKQVLADLDAEPMAETTELYREILAGHGTCQWTPHATGSAAGLRG